MINAMLASQGVARVITSRTPRSKTSSCLASHIHSSIAPSKTQFYTQFKVRENTRQCIALTIPSASSSSNDNEPSGSGSGSTASAPQFGLRQIKGDGRCMFRALAQGSHYCSLLDAQKPPAFLSPDEETITADALRNKICDALLAKKDHFSLFIDSDETGGGSFEQYVENMRQARTFGGEPELAAAVDVIGRPISIFQVNPAKKEIALVSEYVCSESIENPGDWPVPLVYHAAGPQSGHYDLLAPMNASEE